METKDFIGFAITFVGMAFGFGRQSADIKRMRLDVDTIATMHRDTMHELSDIRQTLARIDQRLISIERL